MKESILSVKEKELIAVAVAHTTGCPYCIDIHTKGAKGANATKEEIAESIMVATALKAGSALAHSVNALNAYRIHKYRFKIKKLIDSSLYRTAKEVAESDLLLYLH